MKYVKPLLWLIGFICAYWAATAVATDVDFVRDIRPILSDKCYACHGPDAGQRQADLRFDIKDGAFAELSGHFAIVAGKPDESELIRRVNSTDDDEVMPPPDHIKQLSDQQRSLLEKWIEQGAPWQDHWAYIAPQLRDTPAVEHQAWSENSIDAFIYGRLKSKGLSPSPPANAHTLIRRLSFDLTGLPPTPSEVTDLLNDSSDGAVDTVVDRLMNSEAYGERMAMYWLDLVRYADTVGYHGDQDMSVSPFRDYVIEAFNSNMPFDRFTREQLAGDLLPDPTRDQLIASGYNKLGMMSAEGGVQPKEYLAKYIAERVRTASTVWMGSTLGCAECHDHKFDPFTTKDFYRFAAFFADIKERGLYAGANRDGNWGPIIDVPDEELPTLLKPVEERIAALTKVIDTSTPELEAAQTSWEASLAGDNSWQILEPQQVSALHDVKLKVLDDKSVIASGPNPPQNTYTLTVKSRPEQITGFRIEVIPDKSLPQKGPGRAGNGNFVLSEFRVFVSPAEGERQAVKLRNAIATIEQTVAGDATPYGKWNAASAIDDDVKGPSFGWAILPEAGKPNEMTVETVEPLSLSEQSLTIVLEQNHTNPTHTIGRFRLSATGAVPPLTPSKLRSLPENIQKLLAITAVDRNDEQERDLAEYYRRSVAPSLAQTRTEWEAAIAEKNELVSAHTRTSLITVAVEPREIRVLPRGNWMDDSGEIVQPGVPHFMRQLNTEQRATRSDLADWLTAEGNPLTARVFVNRLWKLFFGNGLSSILDDVGSQGEAPVYPELLDALAIEFVESGWNVKHMVKLIVMSNAYRQSSLMRDDLRNVDPYNRFYARQSRFRLDAEMVRDNALAVSDLLVRRVGGRSAKPYQPAGLYRHLNFPARQYKHDTDENQYRRGLYTHWQRQFLHPAMKAFDAPAREECTAQRPRSNTPLAALVLLNDPSYVEAARVFAEKTMAARNDPGDRFNWMFQRALSRSPSDEEIQILQQLLLSHLKHYGDHAGDAKKLVSTGLSPVAEDIDVAESAAWTSVARTIFNMHEFITRN